MKSPTTAPLSDSFGPPECLYWIFYPFFYASQTSHTYLKMQKVLCSLLFVSFVALVSCRPQVEDPAGEKPSPYQFEYKVEDQPNTLYFGANENGNEAGRVEGKYYVLLPDGRLMTVNYYVDGESGFVPTISFEPNSSPFGKGR
ncbi:hypothetical protein M8J77_012930 [Diaphorina citri]|nr:hypothetical protein M8J77_012930 [Diaphorina citri]